MSKELDYDFQREFKRATGVNLELMYCPCCCYRVHSSLKPWTDCWSPTWLTNDPKNKIILMECLNCHAVQMFNLGGSGVRK